MSTAVCVLLHCISAAPIDQLFIVTCAAHGDSPNGRLALRQYSHTSCTCLRVDQVRGGSPPAPISGGGEKISLGVDMWFRPSGNSGTHSGYLFLKYHQGGDDRVRQRSGGRAGGRAGGRTF